MLRIECSSLRTESDAGAGPGGSAGTGEAASTRVAVSVSAMATISKPSGWSRLASTSAPCPSAERARRSASLLVGATKRRGAAVPMGVEFKLLLRWWP